MQHCSVVPCWKGQRGPQAMETVATEPTDIYTFSNPRSSHSTHGQHSSTCPAGESQLSSNSLSHFCSAFYFSCAEHRCRTRCQSKTPLKDTEHFLPQELLPNNVLPPSCSYLSGCCVWFCGISCSLGYQNRYLCLFVIGSKQFGGRNSVFLRFFMFLKPLVSS